MKAFLLDLYRTLLLLLLGFAIGTVLAQLWFRL